MEVLKFSDMFASIRGKLSQFSDWWIMKRYGKFFTGHRNKKRNYKDNPVTNEERKTRERLKCVVAAYREIVKGSEEWRALKKEFEAQRKAKKGVHTNMYGYFMHREMEKLKNEGPLAADPSKNLQDWSCRRSNNLARVDCHSV